jgi:hypothetical protein
MNIKIKREYTVRFISDINWFYHYLQCPSLLKCVNCLMKISPSSQVQVKAIKVFVYV